MKWIVALLTSVDGMCFLLLALAFLWLAYWLAFRWHSEGLVMLLRSRSGAWTLRALICTVSFCLGLSLIWVVYLNMAKQYCVNEMQTAKPELGAVPATLLPAPENQSTDD